MDSDTRERLRRWIAAERADKAADADAAFRELAVRLPRPAPRPGFADRVVARCAAADPAAQTERPVWTRWWVRAAAATLVMMTGLGLLYAAPSIVNSVAGGPLVRGVEWSVGASLWMLEAFNAGVSVWEVVMRLGRALGVVVSTPQIGSLLIVIELVGAGALYALHRLLATDSNKESFL